VNNFTTDWNSGICLSSLLDYCEPGLFPHWKNLDANDNVNNCRRAMELARDRFNIPMVLEPEYLASPYLDELSGMTYLSYFMKEKSPGTKATLNWVNSQLKTHTVSNFTVSVFRSFENKLANSLVCIYFRLTGKTALYCVN
jgi:filamin